jgi:hypothetical protein
MLLQRQDFILELIVRPCNHPIDALLGESGQEFIQQTSPLFAYFTLSRLHKRFKRCHFATPRFRPRAQFAHAITLSMRFWERVVKNSSRPALCSPISPFVGCISVSSDAILAILVSQAMARRELLLDRSGLSIGKHDFVHLQSPPTPYDLPIFGQFHRRHTPIYKKWQVVIGATSFFTRSDT